MSKLRIFYVFSLVLLGVLLVFTVFKPFATGGEYSEVQREQVLKAKDEWIIQFNIFNREGRDAKYTINILVADQQYHEQFLIQDGGTYAYIHHVPNDKTGDGKATFAIYKEGTDSPIEQITYYLK